MLTPHIASWDDYEWYYTKLKPTGKWRYVTDPRYVDRIEVQHKGWIFTSWISENDIVFIRERTEEVFDCKRRTRNENN